MKVSDILRVKGNTLFTVAPDEPLARRAQRHGRARHRLAGRHGARRARRHADLPRSDPGVVNNGGAVGTTRGAQRRWTTHPLTCTPETELDEVRRMMLEPPRALHAGDERAHADGRDLVLRRRQGGGRQPELREPHAQGLHPRLAGRRAATSCPVVESELTALGNPPCPAAPSARFSRHQLRREPRPGDRLRRSTAARPAWRSSRGRHPARPRPAPPRHLAPRHAAQGSRQGRDPLRRVRGQDHRHADRAADPQHRPAQQGLRATCSTPSAPATPTTPTGTSTACAIRAAAAAPRRG